MHVCTPQFDNLTSGIRDCPSDLSDWSPLTDGTWLLFMAHVAHIAGHHCNAFDIYASLGSSVTCNASESNVANDPQKSTMRKCARRCKKCRHSKPIASCCTLK